jgi:predicted dehydrogenase
MKKPTAPNANAASIKGWNLGGVALAGTGWAARQHARAIKAVGGRIAIIKSHSLERAGDFAGEMEIDDWSYCSNWEQLAGLNPSAAVLADSGSYRANDIVTLARFGIPIVSEKPIGLSWPDCQAAATAVEACGVPSAVALVARLNTSVQETRKALSIVQFGQPRWGGVSYMGSVSQERLDEKPWMSDRSSSGGLLPLLGIHGVDLLLFLAYGASLPSAISSACRFSCPHPIADLDAYTAGVFVLEDGFVGTVEISLSSPGGPTFDVRLQGSNLMMLNGRLWGRTSPHDSEPALGRWELDHRDALYRQFWERIIHGDERGDLLSIPASSLIHQICFALESPPLLTD